ncbi:NFACT RNA binding domain-containing protein [Flectobacillus major]|uniref:NFACT RNA binding domain-containing protein n=1 Tax=Flectobacillus major TaxID=103 RepID=UPI00047E07EE|nr:NFACT RNA binding domain-containing protein [Flectobacillus major]
MQTNYYFLRQLSKRLEQELTGLVLAECFSQEKDELVLGFCTDGKQWKKKREFYIKAVLHPDFACLNFPDDFRRAGRNSVDLFKELIGAKVIGLHQFLNERAFVLYFENDFSLLFKMYGNRSNIILFEGTEVLDLFHNKLVVDNNLVLGQLDRPIDQSFEAFVAAEGQVNKLFPTFGKEIVKQINSQITLLQNPTLEQRWAIIQAIVYQLEQSAFYIKTIDYQPVLSMLEEGGDLVKKVEDPIQASNELYYSFAKVNVFDKEKGQIIRHLQKQIHRTQVYIDKSYAQLSGLEDDIKHEEIANIIMANLHAIPERTETIELYDFYRDKPLKVRLKPDLSPQKNAENYYRKSKNEKIEIQKLMENIEAKEETLQEFQQHIAKIEQIETLREFRKYIKNNVLEQTDKQALTVQDLFKYVNFQGWEILIGKNARNNDLLTQRYARKEDLWLHARDVSGSHVVIRRQAGKKFPVSVIEKAAALAAYYSKRKNDSLCPVIVTPKKYVRKTKDLIEGQVIVDKEEVVLIEPSL